MKVNDAVARYYGLKRGQVCFAYIIIFNCPLVYCSQFYILSYIAKCFCCALVTACRSGLAVIPTVHALPDWLLAWLGFKFQVWILCYYSVHMLLD